MVTPRPTVLLTGFDAFGGEATNPSADAVQRLDGHILAGHRVVARVLPTVFGTARQNLRAWLHELRPALVVATGVAPSRRAISLERVAINLDDARIPDNHGRQPIDQPIEADGPAAYFSTLPLKAMKLALDDAGFATDISGTAGSFVCNHVFYGLMHAAATVPTMRAGFVHLPPAAVLAPGQSAQALALAIRVTLATTQDARVAAGTVD